MGLAECPPRHPEFPVIAALRFAAGFLTEFSAVSASIAPAPPVYLVTGRRGFLRERGPDEAVRARRSRGDGRCCVRGDVCLRERLHGEAEHRAVAACADLCTTARRHAELRTARLYVLSPSR